MDFPKWKYHPILAALIVQSAREEDELGEEWCDTPPPATGDAQGPGVVIGEAAAPTIDHREHFGKWLEYEGLTGEAPAVLNLLFNSFTARGRQGDSEIYAEIPEIDDGEQARLKLLADAKDLGLNLHHRTGANKIQAAIDAKLVAE